MITAKQAKEQSIPKEREIENELDKSIRIAINEKRRSVRVEYDSQETDLVQKILHENGYYYSIATKEKNFQILIKW